MKRSVLKTSITRTLILPPLLVTVLTMVLPGAVWSQIKIGALMPITGSLSEYGPSSINGMQLAINEINATGGVLDGRTLELAVGDTETNPEAGVIAANALISDDQIAAIVGAMSSNVTIRVANDVVKKRRVAQISNASTAPSISTLDDGDYLFRTTPHDALQGVVLARTVVEQGIQDVSIVYVDNEYGHGLNDVFTESFTKLGGHVSATVSFKEKQPSYRIELGRAKTESAQALLLIAYPGDGIPILKMSTEEGVFTRFIFTDSMRSPDMAREIPEQYLDGAVGTAPEPLSTSSREHFIDAYKSAYGALPPHPFVETAYDATYLLALAIEQAQSADGAAIRNELRSIANPPGLPVKAGEFGRARKFIAAEQDIDYFGASGTQNFDAQGDVTGSFGIWTVRNGAIETVKVVPL